MLPDTPLIRPDISLVEIVGYAVFAFVVGLLLTPWFISFLRRNSLGKQLRVETVDGREPTIFLQYHQKKFGTPTMGGLLVWLSIFLTILFSRVLSYFGVVDASLLQRGQVYLPLFVLFTMGVLGALDDYFNIVSSNEERLKETMPLLKRLVVVSGLLTVGAVVWLLWVGGGFPSTVSAMGTVGALAFVTLAVAMLFFFRTGATMLDAPFQRLIFSQGKKKGLGVFPKILSLLLISVVGAAWFYFKLDYSGIAVPFAGTFEIGPWYLLVFIFILLATSNSVNVTDGLDGLAGGLIIISFAGFGVLAYVQGLSVLAAFCAVTVGAVAAFLWHNVPPALFYMGDTGALALGGTLGVIALMTDQVLLLPLLGFVFLIEMLSVIVQLLSKKFRGGKKIFKAAPIHHHFEALEWGESKVTMRLWIVGAIAALFGILLGIYGVPSLRHLPASQQVEQALP